MPSFFIDRPIFAWVVAIFIMIAGAISIPLLPIAQYPDVAPPQISVSTSYAGASSQDTYQSVTKLIEDELNGVEGMLYFESTSSASGSAEINITFAPGTDPSQASVDVQNRISRVEPRLPDSVRRQGVQVEEAGSGFLLIVSLTSTDGSMDAISLGDYVNRNVLSEVQRVPGVGRAQLFATQRSMRIWLDPAKMLGLNLTAADVTAAVQAQNAQIAAGSIGAQPNPITQQIAAPVNIKGQLTTPEEFGAIVLRANADGSAVRLRDVARIEVGGETYSFSTRLNGQPSAAVAVQLSPSGNAMATSEAIKARMDELAKFFPPGIEYSIPYDTSPFVKVSIEKVLHTLLEAVGLVFLVMFLFLQDWRYTLIPTLVVPVALLGTFAIMLGLGFSINVLTLFGMVLAIGILVDDAIVVVENVERIMSEEGLSPREATRKAMSQISGAIIGITLVLIAVFVPMAFFAGSVGNIYRQFSLAMVASMALSALMALTLTPALCATLLKPVEAGHHHEKRGFFGWFNRGFSRTAKGYSGTVGWLVHRAGRFMVIYLAILAGLGYMFVKLPSSFLPDEDQGFAIVMMQLPSEATGHRTDEVLTQVETIFGQEKAVNTIVGINGFSFFGAGQNAGLAFVTLKDWSERGPEDSAQAIAGRASMAMSQIKDAISFALSPPPIQGLGTTGGFSFRLQDRGGLGQQALSAATGQLIGLAAQSNVVTGVRVDGMPDAAQVNVVIDREKANTFGVTFADINSTISTNLGSTYVNDFPNSGRMQRVTVQADQNERMQVADLLNLNVRNSKGGMVPLSAFATAEWVKAPTQTVGYNGYPAMRLAGDAAPGASTGAAMAELESMVAKLPAGIGYEWTGLSREEKLSGSQATILLAFSLLAVFLCLAALYESWSIPLSVMLVVPLGLLGALLGATFRGMPNDVYFKVGLITIIGLSAKNAILIIEFAKDLQAQGKGLVEAILEAAHLRFRPIIMTSLAFILGVTPLFFASGAGSASQRAIGTGVLSGMITATVLAVLFVPVFFVFVMKLFGYGKKKEEPAPAASPAE
ncbi:UNVERIFIED_ORG: multidrug efflux RND transporter permease subunit [Roseateles sp. XES5]|nr:efflux RND transporter permease subunit [Roseateles sp. XES5]